MELAGSPRITLTSPGAVESSFNNPEEIGLVSFEIAVGPNRGGALRAD